MSLLNEILDAIKDEAFSSVKAEFKELLSKAKADGDAVVKKNTEKLERWLVMFARGELDKEEFDALVDAQRRAVREYLNTLEIQARARLEKITMGLLDFAIGRIAPILKLKM